MALSKQRKEEITQEMTAFFAADETRTFNASVLAWSYSVHSNEITPLIRQWLKDGLISVAYTSVAGNKVYRAAVGRLASILADGSSDPVTINIALDYLMDRGIRRADAAIKLTVLLGRKITA